MGIVRDIMARDVLTVTPETSIAAAADLLGQHRIGGMPVVDGEGTLVGMVSVYDIIGKRGKVVSDVMTVGAITIDEDTTLPEMAQIMFERKIRRLPVVVEGKLVGLVSRGDLIRNFNLVHWVCGNCGHSESGYLQPLQCEHCGSSESFTLDQRPPGI
ncbi:MAG: CBS domain-containing protein [Chloroflexi bacterium]|nr:CBS domain-containing protein [Chloroflexota bacterium]